MSAALHEGSCKIHGRAGPERPLVSSRALFFTHSRQNLVVEQVKSLLTANLPETAVMLATFGDVETELTTQKPDLVLISLAEYHEQGQKTIERTRLRFDGRIIAIGEISDPKLILRALQVGADLFLDIAELDKELVLAVNRLLKRPESKGAGNLVAVVSGSGGCGVSTLAASLAATFARDGNCLLIDLNPGRGDQTSLLDLKSQFTLADVCLNENRLDGAMFEKMLMRHASGVSLLGSPLEFHDSRAVTVSGVRQAVTLARRTFLNTVVDLEDCFHSEQVEVLHQAAEIFVVLRLDFTTIRNTRRLLDQLSWLEIPRARIKLVVNQFGQINCLPLKDAEEALRERLTVFIPYDPSTINAANNTGIPVVLKSPQSEVAQRITNLIRPTAPTNHRVSGLLPSIKGFFKDVLKARPKGS